MNGGQLSIVIPTLNAAGVLPGTLESLAAACREGLAAEILVVDGGSSDRTVELARDAGAAVLSAPCGRGRQLAAGGRAAQGDWLLFLHADTHLSHDWVEEVRRFIAREDAGAKAAVFRFALDDRDPRARRIEALVRWRARTFGLPYGDQGLLLSRRLYNEVGGFRELDLMEDVDLIRRLGRRRLVTLQADAVTSARRYRTGGWWLRPARNLSVLALYYLGLPPRLLARLYG